MKYKETKGNEKLAGTIALEKLDVMKMLQTMRYRDISEKFNISIGTVQGVATRQISKRNVGNSIDENEFAKEDYHNSQGAWMNSSERVAYTHFKNI
tara:strand:+ start:1036 stop:1323 length:288 start_codon:yes stop_codon:yes gene_type:complete